MVNYGATQDRCNSCTKVVYLTEKIVVEDKDEKKTFHKVCLKCSHCKVTLTLGNYASMDGIFYCKNHFKQLFATKGNYDESFGKAKATEKWAPQAAPASSNPASFIKLEESNKPPTEKKETPTGIASKFGSGSSDRCNTCSKIVYLTEKIVVEDKDERKVMHKACLKCQHCNVQLNLGTYASMGGIFYCKPHFKQLFATKGNYDEGFGNSKASEKWAPQAVTAPNSFVPVEKAAAQEKKESSNPDVAKKFSTGSSEKCHSCSTSVYQTERVVLEEVDGRKIFHKNCLRCSECKIILTLGTVTQVDGVLFCKVHAKLPTKRNDNPFPYLEKKDDYVPSVERVEEEANKNQETEMERYKRLMEMKYVEDDVPKKRIVHSDDEEEEKKEEVEEKKEEVHHHEEEVAHHEEEKKEEEEVQHQEEQHHHHEEEHKADEEEQENKDE